MKIPPNYRAIRLRVVCNTKEQWRRFVPLSSAIDWEGYAFWLAPNVPAVTNNCGKHARIATQL